MKLNNNRAYGMLKVAKGFVMVFTSEGVKIRRHMKAIEMVISLEIAPTWEKERADLGFDQLTQRVWLY